jgi:hypothetical protein
MTAAKAHRSLYHPDGDTPPRPRLLGPLEVALWVALLVAVGLGVALAIL